MTEFVAVVVPSKDVKRVKTLLETRRLRDESIKIRTQQTQSSHQHMIITTNVDVEDEARTSELNDLGLSTTFVVTAPQEKERPQNAFCVAFADASRHLPGTFWSSLALSLQDIVIEWKPSPLLYPPMLLLRANMVTHEPFVKFLSALAKTEPTVQQGFWSALSSHYSATHVALDAPIPASLATQSSTNVVRSPINFTPLHGDFGPALKPLPDHLPTPIDFDEAFWVSAYQNGLYQIWAPRYTMFSAGNTSEKARVLHMPSLHRVISDGLAHRQPMAAVDLFAGIGYFVFSYAACRLHPPGQPKKGLDLVLAWDLNPWSCEGLRRGADRNGFECLTFPIDSPDAYQSETVAQMASQSPGKSKLIVFNESNIHATRRIEALRQTTPDFPAIRHVNCGMLPSADFAWKTAVEILDPRFGGWLHLHETVRADQVDSRAELIRAAVQQHAASIRGQSVRASIDHVEKVKSIAPRTLHIVVDIWLPAVAS